MVPVTSNSFILFRSHEEKLSALPSGLTFLPSKPRIRETHITPFSVWILGTGLRPGRTVSTVEGKLPSQSIKKF